MAGARTDLSGFASAAEGEKRQNYQMHDSFVLWMRAKHCENTSTCSVTADACEQEQQMGSVDEPKKRTAQHALWGGGGGQACGRAGGNTTM